MSIEGQAFCLLDLLDAMELKWIEHSQDWVLRLHYLDLLSGSELIEDSLRVLLQVRDDVAVALAQLPHEVDHMQTCRS